MTWHNLAIIMVWEREVKQFTFISLATTKIYAQVVGSLAPKSLILRILPPKVVFGQEDMGTTPSGTNKHEY